MDLWDFFLRILHVALWQMNTCKQQQVTMSTQFFSFCVIVRKIKQNEKQKKKMQDKK